MPRDGVLLTQKLGSTSAKNPKLLKLLLKPGVGQDTTLHTSLTAGDSAVLISLFRLRQLHFPQVLFTHKASCNLNGESDF